MENHNSITKEAKRYGRHWLNDFANESSRCAAFADADILIDMLRSSRHARLAFYLAQPFTRSFLGNTYNQAIIKRFSEEIGNET